MSSSTTSRPERSRAAASACAAVVRDAHLVAEQLAAAAPGCRRRRRCRRRPGRGAAGARRGAAPPAAASRRGAAPAGSGRRTTNSLPRPGPVAARLDACRRAARPGAAPASGRCRGRPAARSSERSTCDEQVEDARQHRRRRCRCRCRATRTTTASPLALGATARCGRRRSVYLAALFSRLAKHLREPRRVGVERAPAPAGSVDASASWPLAVDQRPAGLDRAAHDAGAGRPRSRAQLDLAAGDARDVEQVVDQPRPGAAPGARSSSRARSTRRGVGAGAAAGSAARCGSARAGCAARGRASPGTRPCAGRRPGPPRRAALGDVGERGDDADDAAVGVAERAGAEQQVEAAAVGPVEADLTPRRIVAPARTASHGPRRGAGRWPRQRSGGRPRRSVARIGSQPQSSPRGELARMSVPSRSHDDDRVDGLLEDRPGERLVGDGRLERAAGRSGR